VTQAPAFALVLAGSRGPADPVAQSCGLPHKALAPVLGVPMLLRVTKTLLACPGLRKIILCVDPALKAHGLGPELDSLIAEGAIEIAEPKTSPSESVAHVVETLQRTSEAWPLLVTTADHPLLTSSMVQHFTKTAPDDADVALGLAEASVIRRDYPDAVRTFYRFAGQGYSGCNLFLLTSPKAIAFITFWRTMEKHRKRPWRLVAAIGPGVLIRFLIGRLSIDQALDHLSGRIGASAKAVIMPFAEAAIDVDKPGDLILAEKILKARTAG
jgi:GTP:adenosylcobinamide-phosphate guanylyltransferase